MEQWISMKEIRTIGETIVSTHNPTSSVGAKKWHAQPGRLSTRIITTKVALQHDSRVLWTGMVPKSGTVVGFYNTPNDAGSRWDFVPADSPQNISRWWSTLIALWCVMQRKPSTLRHITKNSHTPCRRSERTTVTEGDFNFACKSISCLGNLAQCRQHAHRWR